MIYSFFSNTESGIRNYYCSKHAMCVNNLRTHTALQPGGPDKLNLPTSGAMFLYNIMSFAFITILCCISPKATGETPPSGPSFPWEKASKLIGWRYVDTNTPVSLEWKLPPTWGFGPSTGCSVLVLHLAQLLSLEFGIFRSYLKQESTREPSKSKELSVVLCFPQVELSVLAWFRDWARPLLRAFLSRGRINH